MNRFSSFLAFMTLLCVSFSLLAQELPVDPIVPADPADPDPLERCYAAELVMCTDSWQESGTCGYWEEIYVNGETKNVWGGCEPDENGVPTCGDEQSVVSPGDFVYEIKSAHEQAPLVDDDEADGWSSAIPKSFNCEKWFKCRCVADTTWGTGVLICDSSEPAEDDEDDTPSYDFEGDCKTGIQVVNDLEPSDPPDSP